MTYATIMCSLSLSPPGVTPVEKVTSMILEQKGLTDSGPKDALAPLCLSLTELHLGGNTLSDWRAVSWSINSYNVLEMEEFERERERECVCVSREEGEEEKGRNVSLFVY